MCTNVRVLCLASFQTYTIQIFYYKMLDFYTMLSYFACAGSFKQMLIQLYYHSYSDKTTTFCQLRKRCSMGHFMIQISLTEKLVSAK